MTSLRYIIRQCAKPLSRRHDVERAGGGYQHNTLPAVIGITTLHVQLPRAIMKKQAGVSTTYITFGYSDICLLTTWRDIAMNGENGDIEYRRRHGAIITVNIR